MGRHIDGQTYGETKGITYFTERLSNIRLSDNDIHSSLLQNRVNVFFKKKSLEVLSQEGVQLNDRW